MLYTYLLSFGITVKMADLLSVISRAQSPTCTICCECHICHECQFHISTFGGKLWVQVETKMGKKSYFHTSKVFCFWPIKLHDLSRVVLVAPIFPGIFSYHSFYGMTSRFYSNQGRGHIFMSSIVCQHLTEVFFLTED